MTRILLTIALFLALPGILMAPFMPHDPLDIRLPQTLSQADVLRLTTEAGLYYGVAQELAEAVGIVESDWRLHEIGDAGEIGPFQIMPITWKQFDCGSFFSLRNHFFCAAKILAARTKVCGSEQRAVRSYNLGTSICPGPKGPNRAHTMDVMGHKHRLETRKFMCPP